MQMTAWKWSMVGDTPKQLEFESVSIGAYKCSCTQYMNISATYGSSKNSLYAVHQFVLLIFFTNYLLVFYDSHMFWIGTDVFCGCSEYLDKRLIKTVDFIYYEDFCLWESHCFESWRYNKESVCISCMNLSCIFCFVENDFMRKLFVHAILMSVGFDKMFCTVMFLAFWSSFQILELGDEFM